MYFLWLQDFLIPPHPLYHNEKIDVNPAEKRGTVPPFWKQQIFQFMYIKID